MPSADWEPIPENATAPRITATQVILHSAVGSGDLHDYFARPDVVVESHFWVALDGRIAQYVDTSKRADANLDANVRAISVESADNGDPDHFPWTEAQLDSLAAVVRWAHETHDIPIRRCPAWDAPGVGYHSLALDTRIPTPRGLRCLGDLAVGDQVFDERGMPCRIVGVHDVTPERAYRLRFQGAEIVAGDDHLWVTFTERERRRLRARNGADLFDADWAAKDPRTTQHLVETLYAYDRHRNHVIPTASPLEMPTARLPVDPYVMGLWLGDGARGTGRLCTSTPDADFVIGEVRRAGYEVSSISRRRVTAVEFGVRGLRVPLREAGVLTDKHVPADYLTAAADQRLALLQGLMDTDGTVSRRRRVMFSTAEERMADAVVFLAASLGQKPSKTKHGPRSTRFGEGVEYRVQFTPTVPVFRLPRKQLLVRTGSTWQNRSWSLIAAEPAPTQPMRCLRVDSPNSMYLASEWCIPTHNSMWGAPSHWTPVPGKTCPGAARIRQFPIVLARALESSVALTDADIAKIWSFQIPRRETDNPHDTIAAQDALGLTVRYSLFADDKCGQIQTDVDLANTKLDALSKQVASIPAEVVALLPSDTGGLTLVQVQAACERAVRNVLGSLNDTGAAAAAATANVDVAGSSPSISVQ